MANEITKAPVTDEALTKVLQTSLYPGAAPASIGMVLAYCHAAGLDPLQKPVHIVPMYDAKARGMRDVVMPGIGLYRIQASRTGEYAGVTEPEFGPEITESFPDESGYEGKKRTGFTVTYPAWCRVTVRRRLASGEIGEFTAKEFWKENYATAAKESVQPNAMWRRRAFGQLAKCTEAQALRKAFPELGSQPTAEEMEGKTLMGTDEPRDMGQAQVVAPEPVAYPANAFAANLPKWHALIENGRSAEEIIAAVETKGTLTEDQKALIRGEPTIIEGEKAA